MMCKFNSFIQLENNPSQKAKDICETNIQTLRNRGKASDLAVSCYKINQRQNLVYATIYRMYLWRRNPINLSEKKREKKLTQIKFRKHQNQRNSKTRRLRYMINLPNKEVNNKIKKKIKLI